VIDVAMLLNAWSHRNITRLEAESCRLREAGCVGDAAACSGLAASLNGDLDLALCHYEVDPEDAFLMALRNIDRRYCETKHRRKAARTQIAGEVWTCIKIATQFRGSARRQLLHHHIYSWYISAFWY